MLGNVQEWADNIYTGFGLEEDEGKTGPLTNPMGAPEAEEYYRRAQKARTLIKRDFHRVFEQVDVLATPVTPTAAFHLGERVEDPLAMYLADIFTLSANLAGIPGLSIPCGFTSAGLPIGLQLLGPAFQESRLLAIGRAYELAHDWHQRRPQL